MAINGKSSWQARIDPALAAPLDRDPVVEDALADRLDPFRLEQEVIVDEIDAAVPFGLQPLELLDDVLGTPAAPLALVEDGNVAEDTGPGAAPRGLHRRVTVQREHGRHVERHRLDEVEGQALTIRNRPLVEIALGRAIGIHADRPVLLLPGQPADGVRVVETLQQVEDQLLPVAATDKIDFGALGLDPLGIQRDKDTTHRDLDVGIDRANLAREDLGVGVAGRGEEAQPHQVRPLLPELIEDHLVGRFGIGLIEHHALVPSTFQDGRQRHDPDRGKADDLRHTARGSFLCRERVELRVTDVDQKDAHGNLSGVCSRAILPLFLTNGADKSCGFGAARFAAIVGEGRGQTIGRTAVGDKKVIAVLGATGAQGGGLVRAILNGPEGGFAVRAITRNANSPKAQELAKLGAEIAVADADDERSLEEAFKGAYGAYCVTFFWEHFSPKKEGAQIESMARAAKRAGLQHVIWSTLEDTRRWVSLDDDRMPTLMEQYKVPHFDAKGESDHFFNDQEVPTTFLLTSFYWDNLIHFGMGPKPSPDGVLAFTLPMGDKKLPGIAAEDIGRCAYGIFKDGKHYIGKTIGIAGEHLSGGEMATALAQALGREVRYNAVTPEDYRGFGFPGAEDLGNMFQFKRDFQDAFRDPRKVDVARQLNPSLQSFEVWLGENKNRIPIE